MESCRTCGKNAGWTLLEGIPGSDQATLWRCWNCGATDLYVPAPHAERENYMNPYFYALYQANGPLYGVGEYKVDCLTEAAYWLQIEPEDISYEDRGANGTFGERDGQLYMRRCTERLAATYTEFGGDFRYDVNPDGLLDLDEERL